MAKRIALFNHKGGVSKTTTTFHIGWMLASKGHRVVLVDADPQCNLTGLVLGLKGENAFENFYQMEPDRNIRAGLAPACESQPRAVEAVECLPVNGCEGLFLLPGRIRLSEYEVTLGIAQELAGSIQTLHNFPGALSSLLDITAEKHSADFMLVDMNPSLSSINQNLLMTSDFFIVPTSPDYFSVMAVESLSTVIPRWHAWSPRAQSTPLLQSAIYPYPDKNPQFIGTIIQRYRPRKGSPTEGFQKWIDTIHERIANQLVPTLAPLTMLLPKERYQQVPKLLPHFCLAQSADFNTLIAKSQDSHTPVFALTNAQLGHVGTVLAEDQRKRQAFHGVVEELVEQVTLLTHDASSH